MKRIYICIYTLASLQSCWWTKLLLEDDRVENVLLEYSTCLERTTENINYGTRKSLPYECVFSIKSTHTDTVQGL